MAFAIFRCPATYNMRIVTATQNTRIRALEYFAADTEDAEQIDAFNAWGFDIEEEDPDPVITDLGGPNTLAAHNPYLIAEP